MHGLAEKKRDLTFMVKGLGRRTKCDQVKEEMKTIQQDVLAFGKEKEVA